MEKIKTVLMLCGFMVLAFSSFSAAQQNYIAAKLGGYSPQSNDLSGYNTDFNGELVFGHYFNRNFATEFGVGHLQTSGIVFTGIGLATEDIDATYLEATAKAVFPVPYYYSRGSYEPSVDFYFGGGLGVYFANDNVDAIGFSRSETVPGGHILGGADFNFDRNFFLGLEAKYIFVRAFDTDLDGFIFTGNIGYRF